MAGASIGKVENLEDLIRGLIAVRDELHQACEAQVQAAASRSEEVGREVIRSEGMVQDAANQLAVATEKVAHAEQELERAITRANIARSDLHYCLSHPSDASGGIADCSIEGMAVNECESVVSIQEGRLAAAAQAYEMASQNHQKMLGRLEMTRQLAAMAMEQCAQARLACAIRMSTVNQVIEQGVARLAAARQALEAYLATHPPAAQFHAWLMWRPAQGAGVITPDVLRDRMNLSTEQQRMFQEYLYERNPGYRRLVDRYREQWANASGDIERNQVARKVRIHLSGEFGEQMVRHALAPLGAEIETQRPTFVGDDGRYTKTDLFVRDLRAPVVLGRGDGMFAPVGGTMAFDVKCGKAEYLASQRDHMVFQAEGHKQADAQCTICSRDIDDLSPEREEELRDALRSAGSPLVGMLPKKNDIDKSCLSFIREQAEVSI